MQVGSVTLASNLWLCPIAGYCDWSFRRVVRSIGGVGICFTDLVNPKGLERQTARSMQIVQTSADDQPLGIQLYGTDADALAHASQWCADNGATIVDLNMGCPVKKVAEKGGGSGLLRNCDHAARLAEKVVNACPVPVTVKTRLGWFMDQPVTANLAKQFESMGVQALTIHGRFGEQRFKGSVHLDGIAEVVSAVSTIPVLGNGDIKTPMDAKRMIDHTGCDGVMIGRWALADPWIFHDTKTYLETGELPPPPSRVQRCLKMIEHFENMVDHLGPDQAVINFRKRMTWYSKTVGPCPDLRRQIPFIHTRDQWYDLVNPFLDDLRAREIQYGIEAESHRQWLDDPHINKELADQKRPAPV